MYLNPKLKLFPQATPLLVPLIEEGWLKKPETKMILKKYLRPLKDKKVQALVLACTHYPFLLGKKKRGTCFFYTTDNEKMFKTLGEFF